MMISPAYVIQVLQAQHGVLVAFRDGVYFPDGGHRFVRVLASRAHASGGAAIRLPQVGELGLVVEVDEALSVWLGSLHWDAVNQVDGEPFLDSFQHESGLRRHVHRNGDVQLEHPSGTCLRIVESGSDGQGARLPYPHGNNVPQETQTAAPWVILDHPKAGSLRLHPDGTFEFAHASGGGISVDPGGHLVMHGFASQTFQDGTKRFCMEDFFTWAETHTHSGVTTGSGNSGAPVSPPPASGLSPSTFLGPNG
jgi:hypothetical protein